MFIIEKYREQQAGILNTDDRVRFTAFQVHPVAAVDLGSRGTQSDTPFETMQGEITRNVMSRYGRPGWHYEADHLESIGLYQCIWFGNRNGGSERSKIDYLIRFSMLQRHICNPFRRTNITYDA